MPITPSSRARSSVNRGISPQISTYVLCAILLLIGLSGKSSFAVDPVSERPGFAERRLAVEFSRSALLLLGGDGMSTTSATAALDLLEYARQLDPTNTEILRIELDLATLIERDDLVAELVPAIQSLDPYDQTLRLRRFSMALDRYQTAPERIRALEHLLRPENRSRIGEAEASRLALELAHLSRRSGDITGFAEWLVEAVAMDASNRSAAALAAGYFRLNVDDPYGEAELLTNVILSDPTNMSSQITLAKLLMNEGAFRGATRLYSLAINSQRVVMGTARDDLVADLALALWGQGEPGEALRAIRDQQVSLNDRLRDQALRQNPNLTTIELRSIRFPVSPTLGTVRAVILRESDHPDADTAVDEIVRLYGLGLDLATEQKSATPAELAATRLEFAMSLLWLDEEIDRVESLLAESETFAPLTEAARTRFDGWLAYRHGNLEQARRTLSGIADQDANARLAYALTLIDLGLRRDGATQLLSVARETPASVVGILAYNRLAAVLGTRGPLGEKALQLEQLIATIPHALDNYASDPSLAMSLAVTPLKQTFGPYEPLIVNVTVTNESRFPLAIDRDGPIRPQVILLPTVDLLRGETGPLDPIVVDINRRLRLMPQESMTIPVNLHLTRLGRLANLQVTDGMICSLRALLNVRPGVTTGILEPTLFGLEAESGIFRVDGIRATDEWLAEAITAVRDPAMPDRLKTLALIGRVVGERPAGQPTTPELQARADTAANVINEIYPTLPTNERAWLLAMLPPVEQLRPTLEQALANDHKTMRIAYMLFKATSDTDPILDLARANNDPMLSSMADLVERVFERGAEAVRADPSLLGR